MTRAEKAKTKGRRRCHPQAAVLELLCQRETITLRDAQLALRGTRCLAYNTLDRLQDQRLAVCIEPGSHDAGGRPSIWQIREAFERRREDHQQTEFA